MDALEPAMKRRGRPHGKSEHWTILLARVSLGGKVLMPAGEIPTVGRFSVVQDPTGAVFSPFRSARV
jgi:predicted enzyme related to lactoylglutathione lyase